MKQPKGKIDYKEHETPGPIQYPNLSNVASANECTGLMYTPPQNQAELDSYQHLSPMEFPRGAQKVKPGEIHWNNKPQKPVDQAEPPV